MFFKTNVSPSAAVRVLAALGVLLGLTTPSYGQPFGPPIFAPLVQDSAELRQLVNQLFDAQGFPRLSAAARDGLNTKLTEALRHKGASLSKASATDPEADYEMALVFLLDMERISKMGSTAERNALLYAYPDKVKEYLHKYLARAPSGRYATRARELLKAADPSRQPQADTRKEPT